MKYVLSILLILIINAYSQFCQKGVNYCSTCNPITNLCIKCEKEIYIPNEEGGCSYSKRCILGNNNCLECTENNLCKNCEEGYFPDENGGCSYSDNCIISEKGKCLECKDNFILIGSDLNGGIQICKSLNSEDLKNCQKINVEKGICEKCIEGYYLNEGDRRCSKTENCYESSFGVCKKCNMFYYLNKREDKCILQKENFYNCKESYDGNGCDSCNNNFFLSEDKKCCNTKYCSEASNYLCKKCINGYYISKEDNICTTEENCINGIADIGICTECRNGFIIDYKDGKCKSNQENNEFKYCKYANETCKQCIEGYYLGEDNKCTLTKNCLESENGICSFCSDGYYLGLDNKCTDVEHCIYSNDSYKCQECEGKYYYNENKNKCLIGEGRLENCKFSYYGSYCKECKDDFYLNQTEYLCRSNLENNSYYKCALLYYDNICSECIKGYYLGKKDNKCSRILGCDRSENENKCVECDNNYCLDSKTGKCEYNQKIGNEEKKFYYKCSISNKEGNSCEICLDGYTLNENGLCIDELHCVEKNSEDTCQKCQNDDKNRFCINNNFGCVNTNNENCLECNDLLDFDKCTKCLEGYKLNENGKCEQIKKLI